MSGQHKGFPEIVGACATAIHLERLRSPRSMKLPRLVSVTASMSFPASAYIKLL